MNARDDFAARTRQVIAARAGYQCSNPSCNAGTVGPQRDDHQSLSVGVAAHITAAAPGGPRYDTGLTPAQRRSAPNGIWLCATCAKLIDSDLQAYTSSVLRQWKRRAEEAARKTQGKTALRSSRSDRTAEREIRRRLKLRSALEICLLRPVGHRRGPHRVQHPYDKFHYSKVVIHSLADTAYPEVDPAPGISSWFRLEPFDFYHNGVEFILGIRQAVLDRQGSWRLVPHRMHLTDQTPGVIKVWEIGRIPYRNIRELDPKGDEYYNEPHLYCAFANAGEPYEDIRYAVCGEDNEYDWPLDPSERKPDIT